MGRMKLTEALKNYIKGLIPIHVDAYNVTLTKSELLEGKNCVVTGASRGIGKAIAQAMINAGATVVGLSRSKATLDQVKKEMDSDRFIPFVCDVSDVGRVYKYIEQISAVVPNQKIDVLVNCAGVKNGNDERFFTYTPEEFDYVINTNLKGTFFWCQGVAKHMIENNTRGHIVNITSIKGFIGEASPYSVSKWGGTGLTKGLARILAPEGIVVNGIAPGGTMTDMAQKNNASMLHLETPSMRLADPNEIANIAVFLASDLGSNIIGDIIVSDGGQMLQYQNKRV